MSSFGNELDRYVDTRSYLLSLDEAHRLYALEYAEQLSMGESAPSARGLDRATVREIRRRMWQEWRRRIDAMPGTQRGG